MRILCTECGSVLVEQRDRRTGLPFPACERDPSHGRPAVLRVQARDHRPSKGRWWRAARRALVALAG